MSQESAAPGLLGLPAIWRERVREEWCDYNDHLNMAYYVLIFDHGTDAFFDSIGLDAGYRKANDCSTFAVETHVNYLAEMRNGDEVICTTQLLDFDEKRIHFFHRMYHAERGFLAATNEAMGVHVDMRVRKVAPMKAELQAALDALRASHRALPRPKQQGRVIGIPRK